MNDIKKEKIYLDQIDDDERSSVLLKHRVEVPSRGAEVRVDDADCEIMQGQTRLDPSAHTGEKIELDALEIGGLKLEAAGS